MVVLFAFLSHYLNIFADHKQKAPPLSLIWEESNIGIKLGSLSLICPGQSRKTSLSTLTPPAGPGDSCSIVPGANLWFISQMGPRKSRLILWSNSELFENTLNRMMSISKENSGKFSCQKQSFLLDFTSLRLSNQFPLFYLLKFLLQVSWNGSVSKFCGKILTGESVQEDIRLTGQFCRKSV